MRIPSHNIFVGTRLWSLFLLVGMSCSPGHETASAASPPLAEVGGVQLLSAYYMPDPPPPPNSNAVEGELKPRQFGKIFAPMQQLYTEHADFGGARVVLRNKTTAPVQISAVHMNGKPIEEHYVDFLDGQWDDRGVVWYRVRPRLIEPGHCAQVYIRFRRRPAGERATVTVHLEDGTSIVAVIPFTDPGLQIEYVIADESRDTLYIYAKRRNGARVGKLTGVCLDGVPLDGTTIYGGDFDDDIALAVARLPAALKIGDFHVAGATTSEGKSIAAQFRVLPFVFMRTSFRWTPKSAQDARDMHMNTVFHAANFTHQKCKEFGVYTGGGAEGADGHERQIYEYTHDEPDAKDQMEEFFEKYGKWQDEPPLYTGRAWAVGLGRNAREMIEKGQFELIERQNPYGASCLITNGTTRPLNWSVYGQLADIACTDPYSVNIYGGDHSSVREQHAMMWQTSRPKVMHACMEVYHEASISPRPNTAPEYRQNTIQALGCGAKGINSWVALASWKGWKSDEKRKQAVIDVNAIAEVLEDDLMLGVPIDIVSNDAGLTEAGSFWYLDPGEYQLEKPWMKEKVWTGALLCGPDAIVVAAANHIPASRTPPQHIPTAENVTVTVELPDFLPKVTAFEATAGGEVSYPLSTDGAKVQLVIDTIESGRIFVLRRR